MTTFFVTLYLKTWFLSAPRPQAPAGWQLMSRLFLLIIDISAGDQREWWETSLLVAKCDKWPSRCHLRALSLTVRRMDFSFPEHHQSSALASGGGTRGEADRRVRWMRTEVSGRRRFQSVDLELVTSRPLWAHPADRFPYLFLFESNLVFIFIITWIREKLVWGYRLIVVCLMILSLTFFKRVSEVRTDWLTDGARI